MTPRPYQLGQIQKTTTALLNKGFYLNTSSTGTGKTIMALLACKAMGRRALVVCPKSVILQWQEAFESCAVRGHALNYEAITRWPKKADWAGAQPGYWIKRGGTRTIVDDEGRERKRSSTGHSKFEWAIASDIVLIFDEAHRLNGGSSLASKLLIAAKTQRIPALCLGATPFDNPLQLRALGYAMGLHDNTYQNWECFLLSNSCYKQPFGGYQFRGRIDSVKAKIDPSLMGGVTHRELGDQFPANTIRTVSVPIGAAEMRKLEASYREAIVALQELRFNAELEITEILRARQLAEMWAAPALAEMVLDSFKAGNSPIIFVCFRETLTELKKMISARQKGVEIREIHGSQTAKTRRESVERFQKDAKPSFLLSTMSAGGVGINLHDLVGVPRTTFICPSYSAVEFQQALGRTHRDGALSPSIQTIVYLDCPTQKKLRRALQRKIHRIDTLTDQDLDKDLK